MPPTSSAADVEPMARAHSISSADLLTAPAASPAATLPIASLHTSHQASQVPVSQPACYSHSMTLVFGTLHTTYDRLWHVFMPRVRSRI